MARTLVPLIALLLAVAPSLAMARGSSSHSSRTSSVSDGHHSTRTHTSSAHGKPLGSSSHRASHSAPSHGKTHGATAHKATYRAPGFHRRYSHGKRDRDPEQRARFMRSHPCPSTGRTHGACPGYVVDHVQALKHGGRDDPSNMQWQTVQAAKAKDRVE